jgi:anthranilate phosphoribosyltransferase
MISDLLNKVFARGHLTMEQAAAAMDEIMEGRWTPAQIAGLIIALKQKGETPDEVAGFVQSMRRHSVRINLTEAAAVDCCGTGGDGSHSFNISTAAGFVAAAAGATVAKHGNRSVSSQCGSADLLEALGGKIDAEPDHVERHIAETGFGFMFAPRFHPAMKHAAGPRRELGVRTVFNLLGPMTNPAGVRRQVVGVYDKTVMRLMAEVLVLTGSEHVLVVHSHDGLDEFSVCAPSDYIEVRDGRIVAAAVSPADAGLTQHPAESLIGGDSDTNVRILYSILDGGRGAYRDAVAFNAGAVLYVAGVAPSLAEGVKQALEVMTNGGAAAKLSQWIARSHS